jgi:XapX domain-containing protein
MMDAKAYLIALAVGLLVGVIYGLLNVRSPAPPVVALIGLLGILLGEHIVSLTKHVFAGNGSTDAAVGEADSDDVLGATPCLQRDDR